MKARLRLDPAGWPVDDLDRLVALGRSTDNPLAGRAEHALVIGTDMPLAVHAGACALKDGGSALDAALVTAYAQIALAAGASVSFAGVLALVHYDAEMSNVSDCSAGYAPFRNETDPASIPARGSGRTALVPGFLRGAEDAHRRFGRLDWADLFVPAIFVAETGFGVGTGPKPYPQPELAETLRAVGRVGADHVYSGSWARRFVDVVQSAGGQAALDDLATYEADWSDASRASFRDHDIFTTAAPDLGGAMLIEALHLVELANLRSMEPGDALFWLIQISRQAGYRTASARDRTGRPHAQGLWSAMQRAGGFVGRTSASDTNTHAVVAADEVGNVVALTHTSNPTPASPWGATGLVVDGIPIPDTGAERREDLMQLAPGQHIPTMLNPAIVTRDGGVRFASAAIGAAYHAVTLQMLIALIERRRDLHDVVADALFYGVNMSTYDGAMAMERVRREVAAGADGSASWAQIFREQPQVVVQGKFDAGVLDRARALGQPVVEMPPDAFAPRGSWIGLDVDGSRGQLVGGRTGFWLPGFVEGY